MEHPPITHGLELATLNSTEAWERFFELAREYAALARQRRAGLPAGTASARQEAPERRDEGHEVPSTSTA